MTPTRRELLKLVGTFGGVALMHDAMGAFRVVGESDFKQRRPLQGNVSNASVVILGAGVAGLIAAYELSRLGYKVKVLEYNRRPGGRSWTVRGGDTYTELGGARQTCRFDEGLYLNPGPMRVAYSHYAYLDYCRRLRVPLEQLAQANGNAYLHSTRAFGGKPQRFRSVQVDFHGYVAELLAKAANQRALDQTVSREDQEILLEALRSWGALDNRYRYRASLFSSRYRGFTGPGVGGLMKPPDFSQPLQLTDLLQSGFWKNLAEQQEFDWQPTMFQPVGGMDRLPMALAKEVRDTITYDAKVTQIKQDEHGVTVTYSDQSAGGAVHQARADWCVCAIPGNILSQIPINVSDAMLRAISALYYASAVKVGLQFKRRFWEEDESIYGGITFTDLSINQILYPSDKFASQGKGVLVSGFLAEIPSFKPAVSFAMSAASPEERVQWGLKEGAQIHPQFTSEFENGFSVAWHRVPGNLGCFAMWHDNATEQDYKNLCEIDGRIVLAGEHCSRMRGWQEGAILSSLDAIGRLHQRVLGTRQNV